MSEGDPNPGNTPGNEGNPNAGDGGAGPPSVTINAELLGDYKDDPVFKPFDGKPVADVFKSFKNAQSLIGGEKLVIPAGKLDTEDNWNHVFDRLGRPKDAAGYKFDRPQMPEGLPYDEKLEKVFAAECHKVGILPKQAQAIYNMWNKLQADTYTAIEAQQTKRAEETETALIRELGTKEKYDEYIKGAKAALKRFGGDPQSVQEFVDKFGNDPLVIRVFGNVARGMMEDAAIRGDNSFQLLGEDGESKAMDIMSNKNNPLYEAYWKREHPMHNKAVDEVYRLKLLKEAV
jgi:DNA-binding ferritin-like protein (Dps family)